MEPGLRLDEFDLEILAVLRENGRATNVEIAQAVNLSEAPCLRRIRRLEAAGVIEGYTVRLNGPSVGVGFVAFVTLVLDHMGPEGAAQFAACVHDVPEILSCHIVSGGCDAILQVAAADSASFSEIVFTRIRPIPGVKDVRSSFVMKTIKESPALPVLRSATGGEGV